MKASLTHYKNIKNVQKKIGNANAKYYTIWRGMLHT